MDRGIISLLNLLVDEFVRQENISYDEATDIIMHSALIGKIQDENATYKTWAPMDLYSLYKTT
jgi:hypothetical protein